jgi:hypothetical protein
MALLRRLLAPLTAVWLLGHMATAALVPVTLSIVLSDPHGEECTCGHGDGAMCPMHHRPSRLPSDCAMRSGDASQVAILTVFAGDAGLVPESGRSIGPATWSAGVRPVNARLIGERPVPPDPPPPRA